MSSTLKETREEAMLVLSILSTVGTVIVSPLYIYGIWHFHKYRKHILIQKRFPWLCLLIVVSAFINGIIVTVQVWIEYVYSGIEPAFAAGLSFFVYGLINLRLNLVYFRWKQHQQLLRHLATTQISKTQSHTELSLSYASSISTERATTPKPHERSQLPASSTPIGTNTTNHMHSSDICMNISTGIILSFTIIGFVSICFGPLLLSFDLFAKLMAPFWTAQVFITVVLIVVVMLKKVKDGIGCLKETAWNLALTVFVCILFPVLVLNEEYFVAMYIVFTFAPYLQGLIPLYGGLYFVYKMQSATNGQQRSNENIMADIVDVGNMDEVPTTPRCTDDVLNNLTKPMHVFLKKYENYAVLREYLSHCWAVESLLFLQRVCVLNQVVLRYQKKFNETQPVEQREANDEDQAGGIEEEAAAEVAEVDTFQLEFVYLRNEYRQHRKNLDISEEEFKSFSDSDSEGKQKIYKVYKQIYSEFISSGAANEVNISFEAKSNLDAIFLNEENVNRFQEVNDFLHVFDAAVMEVYLLIASMYNYRFHQYVQDNESNLWPSI